jgi:hypothetical protein
LVNLDRVEKYERDLNRWKNMDEKVQKDQQRIDYI